MKKAYLFGLVALGCIAFATTLGVNKVDKDYTTHRMSSPQMESTLPADASFLTKLEYYIEGSPTTMAKVTQGLGTTSSNSKQVEDTLKQEYTSANKQCSSVIGWIQIPGTDINYPIDYHGYGNNNNYYLHHNWDNQDYWNGSVFLDTQNNEYQSWSLINGHNMLNGIMFAELIKYENVDFAKANDYVNIYEGANSNKLKRFQIVGATYAPDTVQFSLGNLNSKEMQNQFNTLLANPIYKLANYNGKDILMLNTCLSNGTDNHLIILAQEV